MKKLLFSAVLLFCGFALPALAQEGDSLQIQVKGFVDTYHALRTESPYDWMSSRTRVRGELSISRGAAGAFVSANLVHNALLPDRSGLQIREAYASYADQHWDMRAGRQIVVWGVADGLRLTDIISPMDYSEFLAQDYDDIRIPVGSIRLRYSQERWNLEGIFVPVSEFFVLPTSADNPWSVGDLPLGDKPSHKLRNAEYGGRLSIFLSSLDFSVSALRTWNKTSVFCGGVGQYRRMTMLGGDLSLPVGSWVVRSEVAQYLDEAQSSATPDVPRAASTNALLGLDWYAGNDWSLSAQYAHTYVAWGEHRHSGLATFRLSKDLLHNTLSLQSFAYIDVTNGGIYNRLAADYALNDQLHASLGYDYFQANRGLFTMYAHNSEFFIKLKFSY